MSMILMVEAMKKKVGNSTAKLVLMKLADNANDKGECWPSYANIAEHCEISPRSVMNHIKDLESAGFLWREYRKGAKGNKSNIYHLTIDRGEEIKKKTKGDSENYSPPLVKSVHPPSEICSPPLVKIFHPEPITLESVIESIKFDSSESNEFDDAFDVFYLAGMKKQGKKTAKEKFKKAAKAAKMDFMEFARMLERDIKTRINLRQFGFDRMLPATYLNQERWNDEYQDDRADFNASQAFNHQFQQDASPAQQLRARARARS